ncbi:Protein DEHYDRATION-INDUCED 19 homolog 5 [Linum grandiflorum]
MWSFDDYEGFEYESDPVDEILLAEREAILDDHIPYLFEDETLDLVEFGYPELATPVGFTTTRHSPGWVDDGPLGFGVFSEAVIAEREAIIAAHIPYLIEDGTLDPVEMGYPELATRPLPGLDEEVMAEHPAEFLNDGTVQRVEVRYLERATPADAIATRPLVELRTIYERTDPDGFGTMVNEAEHRAEFLGFEFDPEAFASGYEGNLDDMNFTELLGDLNWDLPELDISGIDVSDLGSEDERGDAEGDENARASFPCPVCNVDVEVQILCSHLEDEHDFNLKDAVCPLCAASLGEDVAGHFIAEHARSLE